MNKQEFLKKVAEKAKMSQTDANRCLSAVVDVIVSEVRDNGEQIAIPGLGTFKQVKRDAHEGRIHSTEKRYRLRQAVISNSRFSQASKFRRTKDE